MHAALVSRAVFGLHGYGGMERHVLELGRFLVRAGVQVTLATMPPWRTIEWNQPGIDLQIVTATRLPVRGIADRVTNYPYWSLKAGEFLASQKFDLVHAQGMAGWGYARQLARGTARAPLIINPQGMEEFKTSPAKRLAYLPFHLFARQAARQASVLIAADSAAAGEIPRFLHVPRRKVAVIPNGIDLEGALYDVTPEATAELSTALLLNRRKPILLSVGRLESNKGFDVLIAALARIRPALPSTWIWLLVGEGPERRSIEAQLRALKLDTHVQLLGAIDDYTLHNLYELATLFVHPTRFEGSSLVTLEAMVHRRPIVASAVGGIPDKVLRGRNGYLVAPGDAHELGDKIIMALRDSKRLREMGEASFAIACQTFDWARTIQLTLALYDRVTAQAGRTLQPIRLDSDAPVTS